VGRADQGPPPAGSGKAPTVEGVLEDGPLAGTRVTVEVIEGRPPKTLDFDNEGGSCRYGLSKWVQRGPSARYSYLYPVAGDEQER